jgi:hypothetical protein
VIDKYALYSGSLIKIAGEGHIKGAYVSAKDYHELESRVRELEAEKEGWKETAKQHCKNEDYYRGLVQEIGKHFGADAYTSDDGSIQQDILCAKVPDLVARDNTRLWELEAERDRLKEENGNMDSMYQDRMLDLEAKLHKHYDELRARHAELVEAVIRLENEWDADWPMPYCLVEFLESSEIAKLKAALVEVKE